MESGKEKQVIGFVGTGVMGKSMAGHLLQAGYEMVVYTRTKEKAEALLSAGASWAGSIKELAEASDVIISMVGYPRDVEEIYLGEEGIIANGKKGGYIVDMTTSTPTLAEKIYRAAKEKGMHALDAPVSGGDVGAKNAALSIMVGGDETDFEAMKPIFEKIGKNIVYQGNSGSGQHTKMCNQITIASNMIGITEAVVYAEKAGLDVDKVLSSISNGAAGSWSLSNLAPKMVNGDFEPGFYIKHFLKDMTIAIEEANRMGMEAPGLSLAKSIYDRLSEAGEDENGTQAIYKHYK